MKANRMKVFLGCLFGVIGLIGVFHDVGCAAVPLQVTYQGYLIDAGETPVPDGNYEMVFSIYDVATEGKPIWTETRKVAVKDGVYTVILGQSPNELDPADFDGPRYLGVTVEGDDEMKPRQSITSVVTALVAQEANNAVALNGMDSDDFLPVAGGEMTGTLELAENGLVVGMDQLVLSGGRVGIGTVTPDNELTVAGTIESTSGGFKFPDGTVQRSAASDDYHGKLLALAALLERFELGASFPANVISNVACDSGKPTGASFSFSVGGKPLGKVVGFLGEERISEIYEYSIAISTSNPALNLEAIVGQSGELFYQSNSVTASFPGIVTEFGLAAYDGREAVYVARLEPGFAKLKWSVGYGPQYLDSSLSDIIIAELSSAGLPGNVSTPSFVLEEMRYNESSASFVCRLMEREGCHYHFEDASANIVVGYTNSSFPIIGATLNYHGHLLNPGTGEEFITSFHHKSSLFTGKIVLTGWDYRKKQRIEAIASAGFGIGEKREYWADATEALADYRAQVNMERELARKNHYTGTSNAGTLKAGRIFTLNDRTGGGQGGSYLVTNVRHVALYDDVAGCFTYGNAFSAIPSSVPFRPDRKTPHPQVPEIITAMVTNNIDPEGLGRVKVSFPWDDGFESTWARVVDSSGHKNADDIIHSQVFIPAIDNEVIVTFLQGNPALPVVLGCVHNGVDQPPALEDSIVSIGAAGGVTINSPAGITVNSVEALNISSDSGIALESHSDTLSLSGIIVDLGADTAMKAVAGTDLKIETGNTVEMKASGNMKIQSSTIMDMNASLIQLNGGGAPAARVGDIVTTPLYQTTGTIVNGSSSVRIGP